MKLKFIMGASLLASTLLSTSVLAKPDWDTIGNTNYASNPIGCTTCHASTSATENNVTQLYGQTFERFVDDDSVTAASFVLIEPYDSDGDGFSNGQELRQTGGHVNSAAIYPSLTSPDKTAGIVSAKTVTGGAVSALSQTGTTFATGRTSFEQPAVSTGASVTAKFMYTLGGMQTGSTATFYDETGAAIAATPTNTADGGYQVNVIAGSTTPDGSMSITVKDGGVFDLYSTAAFQRIAKARTPTFTPIVNPSALGANISPDAKISPTASVDSYAVIDAYAIVDNNASIGPYAQIGSYAYIAPSVSINGTSATTKAIVDPYVEVKANIATAGTTALPDGAGYVSATFSVTVTPPTVPTGLIDYDDDNDGSSSTSGGLHCMAIGASTYIWMLFALLMAGLLIRRRTS